MQFIITSPHYKNTCEKHAVVVFNDKSFQKTKREGMEGRKEAG